ncbi:MAG: efflux RND transporter periplasmic adaptor subunit [Acidobacteriota bacterium]
MNGSTRLLCAVALAGWVVLPGCGGGQGTAGTAIAATSEQNDAAEKEAIAVRVEPVRTEVVSSLYSTSATLRADKRATVTARSSGIIEAILVEEGDNVTAGQPLARLEDDEQVIDLARARATRTTLEREFARAEVLHSQGLISDEDHDTARREFDDADHAAALADLELARMVIRAPFAGVVLARHLDTGASIASGTPVFDVADLTPLYADVAIPERHVLALRTGQAVRLTADAAGRSLDAVIDRIAPAVDPSTGTVKVTLSVAHPEGIRPGAFVRADIVTDTHDDALVVSRPALVAEGNRWHLYRLADDDHVEQVEVRLGYEEGPLVEIAGVVGETAPLIDGTPVVIAGAPALSDGARVRVMEP